MLSPFRIQTNFVQVFTSKGQPKGSKIAYTPATPELVHLVGLVFLEWSTTTKIIESCLRDILHHNGSHEPDWQSLRTNKRLRLWRDEWLKCFNQSDINDHFAKAYRLINAAKNIRDGLAHGGVSLAPKGTVNGINVSDTIEVQYDHFARGKRTFDCKQLRNHATNIQTANGILYGLTWSQWFPDSPLSLQSKSALQRVFVLDNHFPPK